MTCNVAGLMGHQCTVVYKECFPDKIGERLRLCSQSPQVEDGTIKAVADIHPLL